MTRELLKDYEAMSALRERTTIVEYLREIAIAWEKPDSFSYPKALETLANIIESRNHE